MRHNNNINPMATIIAAALLFLGGVGLVILMGAVMAIPVMILWNYLFATDASILGLTLPHLSFFQAWALLILAGILFRSDQVNSSKKEG